MIKMKTQMFAFLLGLLGLLGTVIATLLPHWRRGAYVGSNIITATRHMKGLWMECVWQSTGVFQCQMHRSLLALPMDLQAARALMVISCVMSLLAAVTATVGMDCTRIAVHSWNKTTLAIGAGVAFILAGLLCLVTVSWTTDSVVRDFRNPIVPSSLKYEIGPAVFLGFVSSILSIVGGVVLCLFCNESRLPPPYNTRQTPAVRPAPQLRQPPAVFNKNCAPSCFSAASNGYKISEYV